MHGATTAHELLRAGLLDEMEIHLVPVLLGPGRRLFERPGRRGSIHGVGSVSHLGTCAGS